MMIPANTHIWIAAGVTDMRRGFAGLSAMVQTTLQHEFLHLSVCNMRDEQYAYRA